MSVGDADTRDTAETRERAGSEWFRIVSASKQKCDYTRNPTITDAGHLKYRNFDGELRILSSGTAWEVQETQNLPNSLERRIAGDSA